MHTVRRLARREAWSYGDEGKANYNPFARFPGKRRPSDMEELRHTRTADGFASQAEHERHQQNEAEYPHVHRAGTAPSEFTTSTPTTARSNTGLTDSTHVNGEASRLEKVDEQAPETDRSLDAADTSSSDPTVKQKKTLRQRLPFFGKGKKNESDDLTRTDTEKSRRRKHHGKHIPVGKQIKAVLFGSWINVLLLAVPVGFAVRYANVGSNQGIISFVINIVAIIPLAATLSFATEELALYVGETLGGLLNASFGNATELIVSVIALTQHKILIVQTSLIGSMLSNLLLVLGMCFFLGGVNRYRQHFNVLVAQTGASLLALAIGSLVIPTAFLKFGLQNTDNTQGLDANRGIAPISNATAVILLFVYASYLFFQLRTHSSIYNEPSKKGEKRTKKKHEGDAKAAFAHMGAGQARITGGAQTEKHKIMQQKNEHDDDDQEEPTLSVVGALVTLLVSTVLIAFCSDFMVSGIDSITGAISEEFIGLILIPIVGNAAEHATAVTVAIKDKMDLAIGVAVGSSIQIALLVFPLVMVIAWGGVGAPTPGTAEIAMSLSFDEFQIVVLFIAVLLVNYLIQDGESHWLEGVLLMSTYLIIAVAAAYYPTSGNVAG